MLSKPVFANTTGCIDCTIVRMKFPFPANFDFPGRCENMDKLLNYYNSSCLSDMCCRKVLVVAASYSLDRVLAWKTSSDYSFVDLFFKDDSDVDDFIAEVKTNIIFENA